MPDDAAAQPHGPGLRDRLRRGDTLFGTFLKTPAVSTVEVLGDVGLDVLVIDEEHGPFDRRDLDLALLAARAVGLPALVRTADAAPSRLLAMLDLGAAGVIVPHVSSVQAAREVVRACRHSGARGFSASTRAGGYGRRGMWEHVDASDAETVVIAMVEDMAGVEAAGGILAVDGLDGVLVGRADLAVSLDDREPGAPRTETATRRVLDAATAAGKAACLFLSQAQEAQAAHAAGARLFILSSDQAWMKAAGSAAVRAAREAADG